MIKLNNEYLLMIEPKTNKSKSPIEDDLTGMAREVLKNTAPSGYCCKGFHTCVCGEISGSRDLVTKLSRITNSLMVHYVQYHREEIPKSEIEKLKEEYSVI